MNTETARAENRPKGKLWIAIAAILILLAAIAWMGGFFTQKIEPGLQTVDIVSPDNVFVVQPITVTSVEETPGTVTAKQATLISSRILARIVDIKVRAGATVSKGQLLVQLEKTDLQARANQAAQQVKSVQARLTEAQQNLERIKKLFADGLVSRSDLDKAEANATSLTADLSAAKLAMEEAETAVSYTEIKSPIDGRVVDRFAEPGDTATAGKTLLSIYNPVSLQAEAEVREELATKLKVGDDITVQIPTLNKTSPASVVEIVPAANPNSRSFSVKARFEYDPGLLPGMYARLILPVGERQQITVPKEYLASVGQLDVLWVLKDGQPERRFVKTGELLVDGNVEIISGVMKGETLMPPQQ